MPLNEIVNKKAGTVSVDYSIDSLAEVLLDKDKSISIRLNHYQGLNGEPCKEWIAEKDGIKYANKKYSKAVCEAYLA